MTNRITDTDLELVVHTINSHIQGNVELDYAYGGVKLVYSKGYSDVFSSGYITKRELYVRMRALCIGLNLKRVED